MLFHFLSPQFFFFFNSFLSCVRPSHLSPSFLPASDLARCFSPSLSRSLSLSPAFFTLSPGPSTYLRPGHRGGLAPLFNLTQGGKCHRELREVLRLAHAACEAVESLLPRGRTDRQTQEAGLRWAFTSVALQSLRSHPLPLPFSPLIFISLSLFLQSFHQVGRK